MYCYNSSNSLPKTELMRWTMPMLGCFLDACISSAHDSLALISNDVYVLFSFCSMFLPSNANASVRWFWLAAVSAGRSPLLQLRRQRELVCERTLQVHLRAAVDGAL